MSMGVAHRLLIIDDEENMLHMLEALLSRSGYDVSTTVSAELALNLIEEEHFDFILCDVRMPKMNGLDFLAQLPKTDSESTVIMMSAYGTIDMAVDAMKAGAYDFISKPFKKDEVLLTLKKAEERERLKRENKRLRERICVNEDEKKFGRLIYQSSVMQEIVTVAKKIAHYNTTVLITGQSGTGKELLAQAIHENSDRKSNHFFAINCGSIPESLLESELFGHLKGAFTGAEKNKIGLFEEADGATLFLDEIGEMPLEMQVKLLRVLQENEIRPIGSNISKKVDVRIIAATAKDLMTCVQNGSFREDLYYRLNVMHLQLPALNERKDDIPLLCDHFMNKYVLRFDKEVNQITTRGLALCMHYSWPGNVRELENVIQRAVLMAEGDTIDIIHLPEFIRDNNSGPDTSLWLDEVESLKDAQKIIEKKLIERALIKVAGNKSKASKILEISYPSLLAKIKEYNLENIGNE